MRKLSPVILILCYVSIASAQSPHGAELKINCAQCHNAEGWKVELTQLAFQHDSTHFQLTGRHKDVDCRSCHPSLIFSEAQTDCYSCHTDVHQETVGRECMRCHHTGSWIVDDVTTLHYQNGFPLLGNHAKADCKSCHVSASNLQFERIGNDCINCHLKDYVNTTSPDHKAAAYSTECASCHNPSNPQWTADHFKHDFFPLREGHSRVECKQCHTNGNYSNTPTDCYSCHRDDFESSVNPDHEKTHFATQCTECHSLQPGWKPAEYRQHDPLYFPIYSGEHKGEWIDCKSCHLNPNDYSKFGCIICHKDPKISEEHKSVSGYFFNDKACFACHPTGNKADNFNHNNTAFPLTGAHQQTECKLCHASVFKGTSTICADCHLQDFNATDNPDHKSLGLQTDCAACHTTQAGWKPARFDIHDNYYVLTGAHKIISNDCAMCHQNNYTNTPNTCSGCHIEDYNNTQDPPHKLQQISTDCASCHTQTTWVPSTFDHDGQYFPIYSGKHKAEWAECNDCHLNPANPKEFSCTVCHLNPETDQGHGTVNGYWYQDQACLACHPTGDKLDRFDHNTTGFALTGAHTQVECKACHLNGFKGTPTQCSNCHINDFNNSVNPNHPSLGFSTDCAMCHTTQADWKPAKLENHDQYYQITGAHLAIAMDCAACHKGDYNNTPISCAGCHMEDYNNTQNPPHKAQQLPTECATCHTQNAWIPSTFEHDGQYFPIYSGKHKDEWMECRDCHINPANPKVFSCTNCHRNPETDNQHLGVTGYWYQDQACFACHPTGDKLDRFDHNTTQFPLTGAHQQVECRECHESGFKGTSNVCSTCHTDDYQNSDNPNHQKLGFSMECTQCHTTAPDWKPARLENHEQYYAITGAHLAIAMDCAACHKGDYNNTPVTCEGCHLEDYKNSIDPPHSVLQFSTDCAACHTQSAWTPSTFDHDGKHFPIYSGKHKGEWMECRDCHTNPTNIQVYSCTNCHVNPETNDKHTNVAAYFYNDPACLSCHPTGDADYKFDHNQTAFPLTGAHLQTDCRQCHITGLKGTPSLCADCHKTHYEGTTNPNHNLLSFSMDCASCHTTNPDWKPARLDNHDQYYVLAGIHKTIADNCAACHRGNYNNTPNTCAGCHIEDYNKTTDPSHNALQFSTDCASCHSENAWIPSTFEHDAMYFPIYSGKHKGEWMKCNECHLNPSDYRQFSCTICHVNPETDEEHLGVNGYFYNSQACFACHPTGDGDDRFDHNSTRFPLTGAHLQVDCKECHSAGFKGTPMECELCHLNDYNGSRNPNHQTLGFSTNCITCHTTAPNWKPALLDNHDQYYVLNGEHLRISTDCAACHHGDYNNTPTTCEACHINHYNQSRNPNHVVLGIPTDCAACHTTEADWKPATFSIHDNYYEFTGAHIQISTNCAACHHGNYNNTPNTCDGCHHNDYVQSGNPNHLSIGLPTDCALCHTTQAGWEPALMPNHDAYYTLSGAHLSIASDCAACHHGNYNNTPNTCQGCHTSDYNSSTNPRHTSLGLSMDCAMCHTTSPNWEPALFPDHNSYYPLNGAHATISNECVLCHNGNYNNTPNTCVGCHINDYNQSSNPDHQAQQFPTDCASCHTETAWIPSTFDHNTFYALTGAHAAIADDCISCHHGNYNNTPNTCNGCHLTDYNQATNPNHNALGLSHDCEMCHTTQPGWAPASMPNHNNFYPLIGAHQSIASDCVVCHNGDYNNTPNTCVGCHLDDYNQTTDPDHQAAQFPTNCELCHTQNAWIPSTFNHDQQYFPIYSGKHRNEWNLCSDCHTNSGNYSIFSCIDCHEHSNRNQVDNAHNGVQGYSYNSNACYNCHPDGEE